MWTTFSFWMPCINGYICYHYQYQNLVSLQITKSFCFGAKCILYVPYLWITSSNIHNRSDQMTLFPNFKLQIIYQTLIHRLYTCNPRDIEFC